MAERLAEFDSCFRIQPSLLCFLGQHCAFRGSTVVPRHCFGALDLLEQRIHGLGKYEPRRAFLLVLVVDSLCWNPLIMHQYRICSNSGLRESDDKVEREDRMRDNQSKLQTMYVSLESCRLTEWHLIQRKSSFVQSSFGTLSIRRIATCDLSSQYRRTS